MDRDLRQIWDGRILWAIACVFAIGANGPQEIRAQEGAEGFAETGPTEAVGSRLKRLEEVNDRLLKQYEAVNQRNEELSKRVQDLSDRLEEGSSDVLSPEEGGPTPGASGTRGGGGGVANTNASAAGAAGSGSGAGPGGGTQPGDGANLSSSASGTRALGGGAAEVNPSVGKGGRGKVPMKAFYDRDRFGYTFQSDDDEFQLRVNALLQVDSRDYLTKNQNPVLNDFDVPRMRLFFSGRLTRPIEYQLALQRSLGSFDVLNAYLNFHYDDRLQVRGGRFKAPFTYEWYKEVAQEFLTPERSLFALNFGANRQVGAQVWGLLDEKRLEYAVGIFDGPRNSYQDTNSSKDVIAFLDYRPFLLDDSALKNLSLGGSVDSGLENIPLVPAVLRTSSNGNTDGATLNSGSGNTSVPFLAFNNNVRERGVRALWELHATYFYKRLSLLGAWDSGFDSYAQNGPADRPVRVPVGGYYVQGGFFLTGETVENLGLVQPLKSFDLRRGKFGLGAFQVTGRYSELDLGRQVFTAGLADPNLWTNRAELVDIGLNWYLNKWVKVYFDWEHAMFAQPVYNRPGGVASRNDLLWLRLQLWF